METRNLCFLLAVCFSIVTVMVYHFATIHEIISKQTITEDEYNESQITKMISTTIRSNEWIKHKTNKSHGWIDYRLGDMLNNAKKRVKAPGYQYHKSHFPNSLAVQYMDEIPQNEQGFNMTILLNIMKQRKQLYPSNDSLVIHLRIGDILENSHYLTTYFNAYKILNSPEKVFEYFLPNISANNITQVVLVTGFHKQSNDHTKSIDYIIKTKKWFEVNNISVSLRINENPDDDFMFMCNSKYFMQNVRGFSGLIGKIVRLRNGIVFKVKKVDAISSISAAPILMQNSTNSIKFEENTMSIIDGLRNRTILKTYQMRYEISTFIKDETRKLLYCYIPKNSCTLFKNLFYALTNGMHQEMHSYGMHEEMRKTRYVLSGNFNDIANKIIFKSWKSFVVLRNPLERLLSAFLDKCRNTIRCSRYFKKWCPCNGTTRNEFQIFAKRIISDIEIGNILNINKHFRPQYTFCGMPKLFQYFDYVIYYQKSTIRHDTLKFMTDVGIKKFYYQWGQYHNETMFSSFVSHPANKVETFLIDDKIEFYSKYYDAKLAMDLYVSFYEDYQLFNMDIPEWFYHLPTL